MLDRVAGHVVGPERESEVLSGKELYLERRYLSKNLVKLTLCCVDSGASGYIWEPLKFTTQHRTRLRRNSLDHA